MEKESIKVMSTNREARHEYFIEDEYEAGIEEDDEEEIEWVLEEICKVENELKTYKN